MATEKWIELKIAANLAKAAQCGARRIAREPHALAARYDHKTGRIVVDLSNGAQFAFPPQLAQGLAGATKSALNEIVVSPAATGLQRPKLDADLTVTGLLARMFGSIMWMREIVSRGGKSVPERKAAAARVNGAKGGRPQRKETA
ncbi:MAG: DUF2442 domain-containing protein [Betaproteobacteria bacterium]|nr:DUF2442 domain-containing protein [Betaproteobacteria bacterium]